MLKKGGQLDGVKEKFLGYVYIHTSKVFLTVALEYISVVEQNEVLKEAKENTNLVVDRRKSDSASNRRSSRNVPVTSYLTI